MKRFFLILAAAVCIGLCATPSLGLTKTWDGGGGDGLWTTAANWDLNIAPTLLDDVILDNSSFAGTYTVTLNGASVQTVRSVQVGYSGNANTITLVISGGTLNVLTVNGGGATALHVSDGGVLSNQSTAATRGILLSAATDVFKMSGNGAYIHATSSGGSKIPQKTSGNTSATYDFAVTSVFELQTATFDATPTYGIFKYNISATNSAAIDLTTNELQVTQGTLGVSASTTNTFTVTDSVSISSGATLRGNSAASAGPSSTMNITGNVTGAGTLQGSSTSNGSTTITVGGNLTSLISFGSGTSNLTFSGGAASVSFTPANGSTPTVQNVTVGNGTDAKTVALGANVSVASTRTFTVRNASTLNCGTSVISGAGAFDLNSGGTLGIGHANGIQAPGTNTAQIQTTGGRTYSTGANYTYNSTVGAQVTGNGLPGTVDLFTNSNTAGVVTLQSDLIATTIAMPLSGANLQVASTKTLQVEGTSQISGTLSGSGSFLFKGATFTNTSTGVVSVTSTTFDNAAAVQQNFAGTGAWTGTTLTLSGGGTKALSNNITFGVGTLTISSLTTLSLGTLGNDLTFTGTNFTNNGVFSAASGGAVKFTGAVAQTIGGSSSTPFNNLEIANTGSGVTLNTTTDVGASVSNALTLTSDLTVVYPDFLEETGVTVANSSGAGDVVGDVRRTDVGSTAVPFGNKFVQLSNASTITVDVILVKGTAPTGFSTAVKRTYTLMTSGTVSSGTVQLHYLDGELQSNTESLLNLYRYNGTSWVDQGFSGGDARDSTDNFVKKTGVSTFSSWTLADGGQGPLAVRLTRFNAASYSDGVQLTWESGFEVDNLGYHLYREQNGKRTRVTPSIVAGSALTVGPGSRLTAGYSYSWFDPQGTPDSVYQLEAIDLDGSRQWEGPIHSYAASSGTRSPRRQLTKLLTELVSADSATSDSAISEWPAAIAMGDENESSPARFPGTAESEGATREGGVVLSDFKDSKADSQSQSPPQSLAVQQAIAGGRAVKIEVRKNGWYRVTQAELAAAGFNSTTDDARMLSLYVDGQEVSISLSTEGAHLTAKDTLEFYGLGQDTPTTDARVYWLVYGNTQGKRMVGRRGKVKLTDSYSEPVPGSFDLTTERRERTLYFANLLNGDAGNLFGAPVLSQPVNQILTVRNVDRESVSQPWLEVALQGLTVDNHRVQVRLNGVSVGTLTFAGREHPVARFPISTAQLVEGNNVVSLVSTNGNSDISLIDWTRLTYPRQYKADNNALRLSATGGQALRIHGFSSPNVRVIDVTDPNSPIHLSASLGASDDSYSVRVQPSGNGERILIAFTDDLSARAASISANRSSNLNAAANGADMIIITHKDFTLTIDPLANLRRSQGLSVAIVDVEDVYDEFSYGAHTPAAIKSFLMSAADNWSRKPQYLLLVGDSTWDPRNYLGQGENDFVPTKLIDTQLMETGSDDWLADFNGVGLANIAVGRLPVRSAAEASLIVSKIMSYEQERELKAPLRGAVMVADRGFEEQSSQIWAVLPWNVTVQAINRSEVGNDNVMRGKVVDALNQGPTVVNYYGHGSLKVWTSAGLLDANLAANLTNANRQSLYVMMTCLNGNTNDAFVESLGEAVLKSRGGGVAIWASSGFTQPQPQFEMNREFYRLLFGAEPMRLGDAIRGAKAATSDMDVRRTWVLLGDPAMRIR